MSSRQVDEVISKVLQETSRLKVKIKRLHPDAIIPKYAKPGDAGADLAAVDVKWETETQICYGTGLAFEIPDGYVGRLYPRSSIYKSGLSLSNSTGILDSGYRGEVLAIFNKTDTRSAARYKPGDRIIQIIIDKVEQSEFIVTEELSDSERATGGFGHSGV